MPDAVQIHSGYGLMRDSEVDRICRGAKLHETRAGTTEVRQVIGSEEFNEARRRVSGPRPSVGELTALSDRLTAVPPLR